ncbi:MAG: cupredoxin domain-containing protein [Archangium sp.]|nr:cupredoxin domain-containing protein [Archangium sp.]
MRTPLALTLLTLTLAACKKDEALPKPPVAEAPKAVVAAEPAKPEAAPAPAAAAGNRISMEVTGDGFVPANVTVKAGTPVTLVITRKTDETCATDILIDGTDIKVALPLNKPVEVAWTPTKAGKVKFGCAMDMMIGGVLLVE